MTFIADQVLAVGDNRFFCASIEPTSDLNGALPVLKHQDNVARYVDLAAEMDPAPRTIVELGIAQGGGTALLNEIFEPDLLIAIELSMEPGAVLETYLGRSPRVAAIHTFYGMDQADRKAVGDAVDGLLGGRQIDVVIDDASHQYLPTRVSFETLFPRVRTGGLYIIEDWNVDQLLGDAVDRIRQDPTSPHYQAVRAADAASEGSPPAPLTQLALELILIRASEGHAIQEVTINENWVIIERGREALDWTSFRVDDLVRNHHFGFR